MLFEEEREAQYSSAQFVFNGETLNLIDSLFEA